MLEQEKLIARVTQLAANNQMIAAVLMYGSFTQNAGDAYSDVEFYVFINDAGFEAFNVNQWLQNIAPVYTCFVNNYGTTVVIFQNLIRGEFHFMRQSQMAIVESFAAVGYVPDIESMCLYDDSGVLRQHLETLRDRAAAIRRDDAASIEYTLNNCVNLLLMGINVLKRGEAARAWDLMTQTQTFYVQLVRLCEKQTHHWLNPMKNLEHEISEAAYRKLAEGTCGLDSGELARAYSVMAGNVMEITAKLKLNYKFNFNPELIASIKNYIRI